jgi:hypothetical protein
LAAPGRKKFQHKERTMTGRKLHTAKRAAKSDSSFQGDALGAFIREAPHLAAAFVFGCLVVVFGCLVGPGPVLAQSSSNGVYGGYLGSDAWKNSINEEASRRALMEHNLGRGPTTRGKGVPVAVQIVFPPSQTGIDNLMVVTLLPENKGAHSAMAIAVHNGRTIDGTFIRRKGVRGGHSYIVTVDDSMGDRYPIGRIYVRAGEGRQAFRIMAPLLTPNSPHYSTSGPSQPQASRPAAPRYAAPRTVSGYRPPRVGSGFQAPTVGPGFVPPGSN